jgi:hypothetical protein
MDYHRDLEEPSFRIAPASGRRHVLTAAHERAVGKLKRLRAKPGKCGRPPQS